MKLVLRFDVAWVWKWIKDRSVDAGSQNLTLDLITKAHSNNPTTHLLILQWVTGLSWVWHVQFIQLYSRIFYVCTSGFLISQC